MRATAPTPSIGLSSLCISEYSARPTPRAPTVTRGDVGCRGRSEFIQVMPWLLLVVLRQQLKVVHHFVARPCPARHPFVVLAFIVLPVAAHLSSTPGIETAICTTGEIAGVANL